MQATTGDQAKQQQETSLYSSSSDASECGSDGDESMDDSDPDGMDTILYFTSSKPFVALMSINIWCIEICLDAEIYIHTEYSIDIYGCYWL